MWDSNSYIRKSTIELEITELLPSVLATLRFCFKGKNWLVPLLDLQKMFPVIVEKVKSISYIISALTDIIYSLSLTPINGCIYSQIYYMYHLCTLILVALGLYCKVTWCSLSLLEHPLHDVHYDKKHSCRMI